MEKETSVHQVYFQFSSPLANQLIIPSANLPFLRSFPTFSRLSFVAEATARLQTSYA
jgi:hypothetical protein